jgi:serine protease Do
MRHLPPLLLPRPPAFGLGLALGLALALAALSVSNASAQAAPPLAPDALFARVSPGVWAVQASDAQGKVLAVGSAVTTGAGSAVTSCQLLAKAASVTLKRDNVSYGATLEFPDAERDLCQLRVPNLPGPPLALAPTGSLQVGMPLYTVGSPRGRELTLGMGMLAGLRRGNAGELEALQLNAAPAAGMGGAGLFDAQGRLAGMVSAAAIVTGSAELAMPASWIAELPTRGRVAVERMAASPPPAVSPAVSPATSTAASTTASALRPSVVEYRLLDRLTHTSRQVVYRADAATPDGALSFNNGGWVEKPGGEVVGLTTAIAGEFDAAMPPGGWAGEILKRKTVWSTRYSSVLGGMRINMDLNAVAAENTTIAVAGRNLNVVRIEYRGFNQRFANSGAVGGNQYGPYRADVWFSPELGRVVRFDVQTRGGASGGAFQVSEALELVDIR